MVGDNLYHVDGLILQEIDKPKEPPNAPVTKKLHYQKLH